MMFCYYDVCVMWYFVLVFSLIELMIFFFLMFDWLIEIDG